MHKILIVGSVSMGRSISRMLSIGAIALALAFPAITFAHDYQNPELVPDGVFSLLGVTMPSTLAGAVSVATLGLDAWQPNDINSLYQMNGPIPAISLEVGSDRFDAWSAVDNEISSTLTTEAPDSNAILLGVGSAGVGIVKSWSVSGSGGDVVSQVRFKEGSFC